MKTFYEANLILRIILMPQTPEFRAFRRLKVKSSRYTTQFFAYNVVIVTHLHFALRFK